MNELSKGDLIIYEDENNKIEIETFLFEEKELYRDWTVGKFPTVQIEGNRNVDVVCKEFLLLFLYIIYYKINNIVFFIIFFVFIFFR